MHQKSKLVMLLCQQEMFAIDLGQTGAFSMYNSFYAYLCDENFHKSTTYSTHHSNVPVLES